MIFSFLRSSKLSELKNKTKTCFGKYIPDTLLRSILRLVWLFFSSCLLSKLICCTIKNLYPRIILKSQFFIVFSSIFYFSLLISFQLTIIE